MQWNAAYSSYVSCQEVVLDRSLLCMNGDFPMQNIEKKTADGLLVSTSAFSTNSGDTHPVFRGLLLQSQTQRNVFLSVQ
jgi:hypothetical protein